MWRTLLAFLAFLFIRALTATLRYRFVDRHHSLLARESGTPVLYAFLHGHQLMLFGYPAPRPLVQMVSLSRDGDLQAEILRLLGFHFVRGSPGKNGMEALYEMTGRVLDGEHAALAVDGSRGPRGKVKPGIIHLARDSGGGIIPIAAAARRSIILKNAWDRYEIPWPFTRVAVVESEPIFIDPDAEDDELERQRKRIETRLTDLRRRAVGALQDADTGKNAREESEKSEE